MYNGKTVEVVMPAYNEEESISFVVEGFKKNPYVDNILIVNNNSKDKTVELAKKSCAIVVDEPRQGYGYACKRALEESKGDLIILVESDGSFFPEDVIKFLSYSEDFDLVKSSRASNYLIHKGSDWGFFLKYGNWFVSKIMQILYSGPTMEEAGGTYRLIKKEAIPKILPYLTETKSAFLPDMVTISLRKNLKIIEIPVNYRPRYGGESKITGNKWVAFKLGLRMIYIIVKNRFKKL